jgi:uncharacterized membrane protein
MDMKPLLPALVAISLAVTAAPADASERRSDWEARNLKSLHFKNNCPSPVKLAVRYRDENENWVTGGWWRFDGREGAHLRRSSTNSRVLTNNSIVYYYAETTGGKRATWSGNTAKRFGNTTLPMKRKEMRQNSDGTYLLSINCD